MKQQHGNKVRYLTAQLCNAEINYLQCQHQHINYNVIITGAKQQRMFLFWQYERSDVVKLQNASTEE